MSYKIRTKLMIAFLVLVTLQLVIFGFVSYYNQMVSRKAFKRVEALSQELKVTSDLQVMVQRVLMPANDYLITGDRKYEGEFKRLLGEMERLIGEAEAMLSVLASLNGETVREERDLLKNIKASWTNMKELSARIFAFSDPVGNADAARIMEEMDYRWGHSAVVEAHMWHEQDTREYGEAVRVAGSAWYNAWIVMAGGAIVLLIMGVGAAAFYSGLFVKPIEVIQERAEEIARGNFKERLNIKTGDELERLSNAMNEMTEELDAMYSNMEEMVAERTRELRESEEMYRSLFDHMLNGFAHCRMVFEDGRPVDFIYLKVNEAFETLTGLRDVTGKRVTDLIPGIRETNPDIFEIYSQVSLSGQPERFETYVEGLRMWFSVSVYSPAKEQFVAVFDVITERKKREADMEAERKAMMFMLEDLNEQTSKSEIVAAKLKEEMEVTSHLLMLSEATAHTTDMGSLMKEAANCSCRILGADICLSYLWDEDAACFRPTHESGLEKGKVPIFMTETLDDNMEYVKKAFEKREPVVMNSEYGAENPKSEPFPWVPDVGTVALIPLFIRERRLGLIEVLYSAFRTQSELNHRVMQGISRQVSIAIEEARLYKESTDRSMELSRKMEMIQAMNEIDRSILSSLEPAEILETSVRMLTRVVPCDGAAVAFVDREVNGLRCAAGFGLPFVCRDMVVQFSDTLCADVVATGRPVYIPNLKEISPLPQMEAEFLKAGFLSHIRLPLKVKGEVAGILAVDARRVAAFTSSDLSTLEKIAAQVGVALQNARQIKDLEDMFMGTVVSLSEIIDAKSRWTAGHSHRVRDVAVVIGKEMGLDPKALTMLEISGLLHDIGKIGTYENILDKPDKLTEVELAAMKQHSVKGADLLSSIKQMAEVIPGVRHHHEFYDGTGYPDGLKGEEIPLFARILSVADAVDAMAADRPYRKGRSRDAIVDELRRCSGSQFDPKVVDVFLEIIKNDGIIKSK